MNKWYLMWRLGYTFVLLLLTVYSFWRPNEELGNQLAYAVLILGVAPSLLCLLLAAVKRRAPFVFLKIYGAVVLVGLFLAVGSESPIIAVSLVPFLGFPIEWLVLYFRFGPNGPPVWQ